MPTFDFTNASTLSYNQNNNFLGGGVARLNSVRDLTINVFERDILVNNGVSENWQEFQDALAASDNFGEEIVLNGYSLGSGIIQSVAITDQNPVRIGYHNINISVPVTGDLGYLDSESTDYYTDFASSLASGEYIKDVSEDFSISLDEEDEYEQTHTVSVQFLGEVKGGALEAAKGLATKLFAAASTPKMGFITGGQSLWDNRNRSQYFTESYDLLNKRCVFSQKHKGNTDDCVNKSKITIKLQQDGVITVTENGEITGETFEEAKTCLEAQLDGSSHTRCQAAYAAYKAKWLGDEYGGGAIGEAINEAPLLSTLHSQPTDVGRGYDRKGKKVTYDVTYTTYDRLLNSYLLEYTLDLKQDLQGRFVVTDSGKVRPFLDGIIGGHNGDESKRDDNDIRTYLKGELTKSANGLTANPPGRARKFYNDLTGMEADFLKETKTDITYPKLGVSMTYRKEYSDDISLRFVDIGSNLGVSSASFKKMNVKVADKLPTFMRNKFVVPNKEDGYVLLHEPVVGIGGSNVGGGGQTDLGQRTITIEGVVTRPEANVFTSSPNIGGQLAVCRQIAAQRMADLYADFGLDEKYSLIYVNLCSYTLDNNMKLTFQLICNYTTKRTSTDVSNIGIITKEV
jgi:hypothetical protein